MEEVDSLALIEEKRKKAKGRKKNSEKWKECEMVINENSRFYDNIKIYNKYLNSAKAKTPATFESTYLNYLSHMMILFEWASVNYPDFYIVDKEYIKDKLVPLLEDFMSYLKEERGNNSRSINTKIASVSSFYIWATKRNLVDGHPFRNKLDKLKMGADDVRESFFLTDEQIEKINKTLLENIKTAIENKETKHKIMMKKRKNIIWRVMLDSAGRRRAIVHIKVKDINFKRGLIENVIEKGGKAVEFVISDDTMKMLREYIEEMELSGSDYILPSARDTKKHMSYSGLAVYVKEIGEIVGIDNFYPHSIRKTRINQICDKFGLDVASSYANHKRSKVTKDHYVKPKSAQDLRSLVIGRNEDEESQ